MAVRWFVVGLLCSVSATLWRDRIAILTTTGHCSFYKFMSGWLRFQDSGP